MDKTAKYIFEKEQIDRMNRRIIVVEKYQPDLRAKFLTEKFYARHDACCQSKDDQVEKYKAALDDKLKNGPRELLPLPVTESQKYGWLLHKAFEYDEKDRELFAKPRILDDVTRIGIQIFQEKLKGTLR